MKSSHDSSLDAVENAISQFMRAASRHRTWDKLTAQAGIVMDRTGALILKILATHTAGNGCRLQEIAHMLGVEAPFVTRKVQQLEEMGLVSRGTDAHDRRASSLHLTPEGRKVMRRLYKVKRAHLESVLAGWSEADRQLLASLLVRFAEDMHAQELHPETIVTK